MVMSASAAVDVAGQLAGEARASRTVFDEADKWLNSEDYAKSFIQSGRYNTPEKIALMQFSEVPILRLIVEETAQQMIVEGVTLADGRDPRPMFSPWGYNGMPSRESALWEAVLGYGHAYVMVQPGEVQFPDGRIGDRAWIRPYSPLSLYARYADPADDEWPEFAYRVAKNEDGSESLRVYDEEAVYYLGRERSGEIRMIETRVHGLGVCPIVQFAGSKDLQGRTPGEVDKNKTNAKRLIKTTYDRMLIQHHNSWRVITATGLEMPDDDAERAKFKLAQDTVLTGEPGVEFGSLPETQIQGILQAAEADVDMLAASSQTPVWTFNGGQLVNLSADALTEARSAQRNKIRQKQKAMGRSVAQVLRLAASAERRWDDANDFSVRVQWEDVEARSLSQAADALGKLAAQLGIPPELLWDMIPGVSSTDVEQWREYAMQHPVGERALFAAYDRQMADNG